MQHTRIWFINCISYMLRWQFFFKEGKQPSLIVLSIWSFYSFGILLFLFCIFFGGGFAWLFHFEFLPVLLCPSFLGPCKRNVWRITLKKRFWMHMKIPHKDSNQHWWRKNIFTSVLQRSFKLSPSCSCVSIHFRSNNEIWFYAIYCNAYQFQQ